MKKYKKIIIGIIVFLIIISISYGIYAILTQSSNSNENEEKVLSEIKYLESKFLNIFNTLNNIEYENYKIYVGEITNNNQTKTQTSGQSNSNGSSNQGESGGSSSSGGESGSSTSSPKESSQSSDKTSKKYNLEAQGVLTNKDDINWDNIKNEVELIYTSSSGITLDLYQVNLNKDDILNFNKDLDKLTASIKNEDKKKTLSDLSTLYNYLPKFLENVKPEETYKISVNTKKSIFEAYSILDSEDWQTMSQKISDASNTYNYLLTNYNNDQKQYEINKCYIMINEMQNAINSKDKEIFLIKYKNLLEEISNI